MRHLITGITTALLLAAPALQAEELSTEIVPMLYFNTPFGSAPKSYEPVYGFQLTHARDGFILFENDQPAMLDFQMKNGELSAVTVNGLNAITRTNVLHANGSTSTQTDIHWGYVVGGVLGLLVLCEAADCELVDDDDDDDDEDEDEDSPEPAPM